MSDYAPSRVDINRIGWVGPLTIVASVAAVLVVRTIAVMILRPAPQFTPLGWGAPALDTAILVTFAVLVFGGLAGSAADPIRTFKKTARVVLLVSMLPGVAVSQSTAWGGNWPNAIALMLMHVTGWFVCVRMLTTLTVVPPVKEAVTKV